MPKLVGEAYFFPATFLSSEPEFIAGDPELSKIIYISMISKY